MSNQSPFHPDRRLIPERTNYGSDEQPQFHHMAYGDDYRNLYAVAGAMAEAIERRKRDGAAKDDELALLARFRGEDT